MNHAFGIQDFCLQHAVIEFFEVQIFVSSSNENEEEEYVNLIFDKCARTVWEFDHCPFCIVGILTNF